MAQKGVGSIEKRTGWAKPCPSCAEFFRFTKFTNRQGPVPFFYSASGKDLLLRQSDREKVDDLYKATEDPSGPTIQELKQLWLDVNYKA